MKEHTVWFLFEMFIGISGLYLARFLSLREARERQKRNHWRSKETIGGDSISEGH